MNDMIHTPKCILYSNKRLGGPVVIAFRSEPEGWWFKSWCFQTTFSFWFINFSSLRYPRFKFSSFQPKKWAQKLFVQFHYFNVFMYVSIIYDKKQESKVLGYLSRLSINFWTGWYDWKIVLQKGKKTSKNPFFTWFINKKFHAFNRKFHVFNRKFHVFDRKFHIF